MIPSWATRWQRPLRIAAEMAVAFAGLAVADWWLTGGTGFDAIQPNPIWLPVLAMALAYGAGAGLSAAALASAFWLFHAHDSGNGDYLDQLFQLSLQPLLWSVAAVAIGEVTTIRTARHIRLQRRGDTAIRNVARLTEAFDRLSRTNRILQVQIAAEARTMGHVIATATRLSALDPAARREAIAQLIAMAMRTEDFTCYRIDHDEAKAWLRGAATTGQRDALPSVLIEAVRQRRGVVHVVRRSDRAALHGIGVAAIPLIDPAASNPQIGDIVGCLVLHNLPFTALNAHRMAEMAEVGTWLAPLLAYAGTAVNRAARPTGLVA